MTIEELERLRTLVGSNFTFDDLMALIKSAKASPVLRDANGNPGLVVLNFPTFVGLMAYLNEQNAAREKLANLIADEYKRLTAERAVENLPAYMKQNDIKAPSA